ncbi:hypothetical protein NVS55_27045 [Myxococcus stipitatus]|uniref:hypothetical protein n=1 Tax=Myxococcus stipitatus TaxID=83455 RepID=UPI00314537D5
MKPSPRNPGAERISDEIPDPPPERDRGLRAPVEEADSFSAKLAIPVTPTPDETPANDDR